MELRVRLEADCKGRESIVRVVENHQEILVEDSNPKVFEVRSMRTNRPSILLGHRRVWSANGGTGYTCAATVTPAEGVELLWVE